MSRGQRALDAATDRLQSRLATVATIAEKADGRLPDELVARLVDLHARSLARLGHGAEHTVVALAGATGSGKSSTFNAIVGGDLAATGVRRPTTSTAQAVVFTNADTNDAGPLLDWLQIPTRHIIERPELAGLVLLDLPDHDSIAAAHRAEVDRLAEVVDVFCWVVDPQKYADAALHHGYLRQLSHHAEVTIVVLNQIDRIAVDARPAAVADLQRLLDADGLGRGVRVVAASALTGEGIDSLRRELAARVAERRAVVSRLHADLDWTADQLDAALTGAHPEQVPDGLRGDLAAALADAAGAQRVAAAVDAQHRHDSRQVAGWPPTRWVGRLKPDPLRRLGLGRGAKGATTVAAQPRTSLGQPPPMAAAAVDAAIRQVVTSVSGQLPEPWRERIGQIARARRIDIDDALDRAVAATELPDSRPRWWMIAGVVQRLVTLALLVGLVWMAAIAVFAWFKLPDLPEVKVRGVHLAVLLAAGGALAGWIVAAGARWVARRSAQWRGRMARRRVAEQVEPVGEQMVIGPVNAELAEMRALVTAARSLRT